MYVFLHGNFLHRMFDDTLLYTWYLMLYVWYLRRLLAICASQTQRVVFLRVTNITIIHINQCVRKI